MSTKSLFQLLIPILVTLAMWLLFFLLSVIFALLAFITGGEWLFDIANHFCFNIFQENEGLYLFWVTNVLAIVIAEIAFAIYVEEHEDRRKK